MSSEVTTLNEAKQKILDLQKQVEDMKGLLVEATESLICYTNSDTYGTTDCSAVAGDIRYSRSKECGCASCGLYRRMIETIKG